MWRFASQRWFAKSHFGNHKGFEVWIFSGGSKSRLFGAGSLYTFSLRGSKSESVQANHV